MIGTSIASSGDLLLLPSGARAIVARLDYRDASDPKAGPKIMLVTEARRELTAR